MSIRRQKWFLPVSLFSSNESRAARRRRKAAHSKSMGAFRRTGRLEHLETRDLLTAVVVNSINDDATLVAGQTTLRDAIQAINASADTTNSITFDSSVFNSAQTITLTQGPLDILNNVTITGSPSGVTVSGNDQSRVFTVGDGAGHSPTVELAKMTITHGNTNSLGGGILNNTGSTLTVLDSTISDNLTAHDGGGLFNFYGTVNLTNCTLTGNIGFDGAALKNYYGTGAVMTLTNCTIVDNVSYDGGGAIDTFGEVVLNNSIVANNISSTPQTYSFYIQGPGTITGSNDLIYDSGDGGSSSSAFLVNSTLNTASPLLGSLGNYGGPTQTFPPLAASPAIDAGSDALIPAGIITDQRGLPRIVDGTVDIGAFELQNPEAVPPVVTIAGPTGSPVYGQQETFTASVTFGGAPLPGGTVNFLDGNSVLASNVSVNAAGQAILQTSLLSAGSHTIEAHYNGTFGFSPSDTSTGATVDVAKANAIVVVTPYSVTYDGNAHTAAGTATGVNGENLAGELDLSGTTHTSAGTYNGDAWSFAGDNNYNSAAGTVDDAIVRASPSLSNVAVGTSDSMLGAQSVVLGTEDSFTASATLGGGMNATGTLTFTLLDPNGNTAYTDAVPVNSNGAYNSGMTGAVTGSPVPTMAGTYQWTVAYSGDGNNQPAGPTANVPETAVGPGATVVGGALYLVGGNAGDWIFVSPVGASANGSTGVRVNAWLNGGYVGQTFGTSTPVTSIIVSGFGGNDNIAFDPQLTIPATVVEGGGNDNIALDNANNSVLAGDGNDNIFAAGGSNTITAGNGNDNVRLGLPGFLQWWLPASPTGNNVVTLGTGNDNVSAGDGDNIVTIGNGNDNVNLGNGDNQVTVQGGQPARQGGWWARWFGGGPSAANIQLGGGDNVVTAGDSNVNVTAGNGGNTVVAGNGNNSVRLGAPQWHWSPKPATPGNNVVTLGNGNDQVAVGDGNNTVSVGSGNDCITAGDGNNVIVAGGGNGNIRVGDGDNLIVGGGGHDNIRAGDGDNILIDGSVAQTTDQLSVVLNQWMRDIADGDAATQIASDLANGLLIDNNTTNANTLRAGRGFDAFFATYGRDHVNAKPGDLLNGAVVTARGR